MSKDPLDSKTSDTFGLLWKVNFQYIDLNDFIRSKTLVIESPNAVDAQKLAETKIKTYKYSRVISVKPY